MDTWHENTPFAMRFLSRGRFKKTLLKFCVYNDCEYNLNRRPK